MGKNEINIAFAADESVAPYLYVAMLSLFENVAPSSCYNIRVLTSENFSKSSKDKLLSLLDIHTKHSIGFFDQNGDFFGDIELRITHITKTTFYRLLLPTLFSDWNKCIYLDCDVIVLRDLSDLFFTELEDNLIAGVIAAGYHYPIDLRNKHRDEIGLPQDSHYINAGVVLMDLKKMRDEDISTKFLELSKNNYASQDQDVINVACFGRIKLLPLRFNAMTKYTAQKSAQRISALKVYSESELNEADSIPYIIHFADRRKPWNEPDIHLAKVWLDFAKRSPF